VLILALVVADEEQFAPLLTIDRFAHVLLEPLAMQGANAKLYNA
jgi:hypothetical protein